MNEGKVKIIKNIKIYCDSEKFIGGQKKYRSVFRKEEAENIYVDVTLNNVMYLIEDWEVKFMLILYETGPEGNGLGIEYCKASVKETEMKCKLTACFANKSLAPGGYSIIAKSSASLTDDDISANTLGKVDFHIVDLPEDNGKCFSLERFALYRIEQFEDDVDFSKNSQSSFDLTGLQSVALSFVAHNKLSFEWPSEFIVSLFDNTGMLKEHIVTHGEPIDADEEKFHFVIKFGKEQDQFWRTGDYRIEVIFMTELIIVAPFVIGDKDIESIFDPLTLQSRKLHGGKKIIAASMLNIDPLEQFNNMIGLRSLKKSLKQYIDRVEYSKRRKEAGIDIKPISLHSVFLGNPGTGKTSVAKLMGKIFHEMGLLSKGHVVFEERNTLTGKYWGTEEEKTNKALERAQGGVLFIDEAYSLAMTDDPKDPGLRIIETLLTTLSDESNRDIMIVLAGYPNPMNKMLNKNPGMKSRLPNIYHFDDYDVNELMQIAESYMTTNSYTMTEEAKEALRHVVENAYNQRDDKFGNGRYIISLFENTVIQNLASRVVASTDFETDRINIIEKSDIPQLLPEQQDDTLSKLEGMVGLANLKKSLTDHLNFVRFAKLRNDRGKYTPIPPLHMIFTGNPGTGKTTVADFIGEIYRSLGILSRGHLVQVTRSDLVDTIVGGTEKKTKITLETAMGGVLFIDEAYTLLGQGNDTGRHVLETLMTTLSKNHIDLVVILAGYPEEMNYLLASNTGLKSRFPYTFHFEDYSPDELMKIADQVIAKQGFSITPAAREALNALVDREHKQRDAQFGNARYITRLITTQIIPKMSSRILGLTKAQIETNPSLIETIEIEDVPIEANVVEIFNNRGFDEKSIIELLAQLDAMVGLTKVKEAIHKFVNIAHFLNSQGKPVLNDRSMKWNFTGNTGTGKSTVAEIFAGLLKALNLLSKGHLIEIKAEELYCVPSQRVDETLKRSMLLSQQGLLFIDGDAPVFKNADNSFDIEQLRIHLSGYASVLQGPYALVIAEQESPRQQASTSDLASFDHIFVFDDYTEQELLLILQQMLQKENMTMDEAATQTMRNYISGLCSATHLGYANARTMRISANTIINNAYLRISTLGMRTSPSDFDSCINQSPTDNIQIIQDDVATFVWIDMKNYFQRRRPIGFVNN